MWLHPPLRKICTTRFALGAKWGDRGISGDEEVSAPYAVENRAGRVRAPIPMPQR
jgi:hypothetical protein